MTIELQNITKAFGSKVVVDNVNLAVQDGEFVVLLGPSGCGKTTTLRMIAGLEKPTSGEIYLGGLPVTHLTPKDRRVAMVFQDYGLYPHMTVFDNVGFPLKIARVSKVEIAERVMNVLSRLRIDHLAERKPAKISGGEKQRVSLARALVRKPSVLLMDEPLSNLDALLRVSMRTEIKELHQELGTTTLYVTHDQVEALSLGTRIVVMREAALEQIGSPSTIYHQPATRFVGQFVGSPSMNFVNVHVTRQNDDCLVVGEGISLVLPLEKAADLSDVEPGTEVAMGIRPEHLAVSQVNGDQGIRGKVHIVEPLGKDHYLHVQVNGGLMIVRTDPDEPYEVGDEVQLMPYYRHVFFFNLEDGKRIWQEPANE